MTEGERIVHNPLKDGDVRRMEVDATPCGPVMHLRGGVSETAINTGATRFQTIIVELLDDPR